MPMQEGVDFMDDRGKKRLLLPTEADEFGFAYEGDTIIMRSVYDNIGREKDIFLRVLVDGVVSCYTYWGEYRLNAPGPNGAGMGQSATLSTILQHSNGELVVIRPGHYRTDLMEFFADCPALVEKIKPDVQHKMTLEKCAQEYNKSCR